MSEIKIHKIDATGKTLGRLATEVAVLLRGKQKANFLKHVDRGDAVEVFNVEKLNFSGKKLRQKIYYRHSGYPGGLKMEKLEEKFKNHPEDVFRRAVFGMLPKNRTRAKTIKKLKIHAGEAKA